MPHITHNTHTHTPQHTHTHHNTHTHTHTHTPQHTHTHTHTHHNTHTHTRTTTHILEGHLMYKYTKYHDDNLMLDVVIKLAHIESMIEFCDLKCT